MANADKRPLKAFLCHASGDKPPVRDLYKRLTAEGVNAWLDKEKLLPGQDWRMEIPRAVRDADVVIVCLSKKSITKEGYVQKEIKFALDIAEEKPEGTIFLIPARLEDCVVPDRLNRWQWVDLYEDEGFVRLLRSLKLRADAVDATVEPTSYIDSEKETDLRLEQLYTEGLAAFYTEDWDKACQRYQSILSERPNHKNASEKLEEAKRQRDLAKLYEQAIVAVRSDDWVTAIQILEELSNKSADYKDAAQLLRNARKQKQLRELYAEANALYTGQQWEAVVKVFEQISAIDPNYPDADELLPPAQKEVAKLRRLAELNDKYSHALREMDSGNWYEASRLLEAVHKSETGFLETEKLLRKVENEILLEEEKRKQNDQINTLYEQAHGLLRSEKWRNVLEKMDQIQKLDDHFVDTDGITEQARKELAREEQEAERQNKLAALYAEAVKLLNEEKYQEALDKWGEVRAIDPKYPDRQWVQLTAKRKQSPRQVILPVWLQNLSRRQIIFGGGTIVLLLVVTIALSVFNKNEENMVLPTLVTTNPLETPTRIISSPANSLPKVVPTTTIPIDQTAESVVGTAQEVGIVLPMRDSRWLQDETLFKDALDAAGLNAKILFSQGDSTREKNNVESLISQGIKILIIEPNDGIAAAAAAEVAHQAGVKVISYDRLILDTDAVDYYVTFDSNAVGDVQAQYLVDKAEGTGNPLYLYAGAASDNNAFLFFKGAWKVLQPKIADGTFVIKNSSEAESLQDKAELTRDEIVAIIDQVTTNWDFDTAKTLAESNLKSTSAEDKGDVFILAPNDCTARAIADAFAADGDVTSYVVTGQDADMASIQYIIDGKQSMTVLKDVRTLVGDAIAVAIAYLRGGEPQATTTYNNGEIDVPAKPSEVITVDQDNVQETIIDSGYWQASDFTGLP